MSTAENKKKGSHSKLWMRLLKIFSLTAVGIVLFVVALLLVTVSILTPERLTPLVERVATASLVDAEVKIDRVELSLRRQMPFLTAEISNLSVVNTKMQHLPDSVRTQVPQWADTVLSVTRFEGGMNVAALLLYKVSLSDVIIEGPSLNAVVVNDKLCNYDIFPPSEEPEQPSEPFDWTSLPTIKLKRFAIENPRPLRYLDVQSGTFVEANFKEATISGKDAPLYRLDFGGNVSTPMVAQYLKLTEVNYALKGDLLWDQDTPYRVAINNMQFELPLLKGKFNSDINFKDDLIVEKFNMNFEPISISEALDLLPDSLRRSYSIPDGIETNAQVVISGELTEAYNVSSSHLPHGKMSVKIPDAKFSWQDVRFDNLAAEIEVNMPTDKLDDIVVDFKRINVRGPATDLTIKGTVTNVMTDPLFDGDISGTCDLAKLPPVISSMIPGTVSGYLQADARIVGRPSMFTPQDFHRLKVDGSLTVDRLNWADNDSVPMRVFANHAQFTFGTNDSSHKGEKSVDSLLCAHITVDTASVDQSEMHLTLADLKLGVGAVNKYRREGDRSIVPMGGGVHLGRMHMMMTADSTILRVRHVDGNAVMRSHNNDYKTPEFIFNLGIERLGTGTPEARLMVSNAKTSLVAYREPQGRHAKAMARLCDSIAKAQPNLQLDSVYKKASRIYSEANAAKRPVMAELDSTEVIDLGVDAGIKQVLLGWSIKGSLTAKKAGMYTPYFPIRNRLSNVNVSFSNDSIVMRDITYKAGHSDFTLSGSISNIRRALTSGNHSPLRMAFNLQSDTIDVNQLTETVFAGSDYANRSAESRNSINLTNIDNEDQLEKVVTKTAVADTMTAFLVPKNIDAVLHVHAHHVLYSDLMLNHMDGKVMVYDGSINMDGLKAQSDVGSVDLTALYMGRSYDELKFGFGMKVKDFHINRFLQLVPAVDSIMPILRDFSGIISADIAATSNISRNMDIDMPSLQAAIKLSGDSLVLIDPETFKIMSKWLLFKDKNKNVIDHMDVQLTVEDNVMQLYPFIFDFDRYKIGVQGSNDLAMNFNYHVAVLKSPIPFKFGINIKGNTDKYKIRLGRAKLNEKTAIKLAQTDTTRVNLVKQIQNVFRRGVRTANFAKVNVKGIKNSLTVDMPDDTLSHLDSLRFIQEGLIDAPDTIPATVIEEKAKNRKSSKKTNKNKNKTTAAAAGTTAAVILLAVLRRRRENE